MNAVRGALPQGNTSGSSQLLAQPLKAKGCVEGRGADPRRLIADRYPAGLISDDELEALLNLVKP